MRQIGEEELKKIQLDILEYANSICKKNNINYSLACGTLLGAVRHKGYIPWDDDIDIAMLRNEYEKFIDAVKKDNHEYYKILSMENKGYWYPYAKLTDDRTFLKEKNWPDNEMIGVNIDVFPIDYVLNDDFETVNKEYSNLVHCLENNLTDIAFVSDSKIKRVIKKITRWKLVKNCRKYEEWYWKDKIKKYAYSMKESNTRCFLATDLKPCKADIFDDYSKILFEGKEFQIVKRYDELLKAYYGDYMKLPPKEKQISNHDFVPYWK